MRPSGWILALACCSILCLSDFEITKNSSQSTYAVHSLSPDTDASLSTSSGGSSSSSPDVRITVSVSEHFVTLSCDVTGTRAGADDHKVQFFCPVLPSDVQCYGDCSPICTMQTDGSCRVMDPILDSRESISCQKVVSREAKSVRLRIDTRQAQLAGHWRCKFRGTSSATVSLDKSAPAPVAARSVPTPMPPAAAAAAAAAAPTPGELDPAARTERPHRARATASSSSSADPYGLGVWNPGVKRYPSDFASAQGFEQDSMLARFARMDYIIGVLTVMSVSLMLNLGFCIRFILARHYVETRKRNHRKPLGWLGSCLCVSTVQVTLDPDAADADGATAASAAGAANAASSVGGDPSRRRRQGEKEGNGGGLQQQLQRQHLLQLQHQHQQQLPCLYCMQADCKILYDDVARSASDCGSSCSRGASFRCGIEAHAGRGSSLLGVPAVPEETAAAANAAAASGDESMEQQDGSESGFSASDPSSRLELSRRMLRKADTLLREANSLLLETDSATDQQSEQ